MRHVILWLLSPPADEDELGISELWNVIEKAYLTNTATSIDEYWEVESPVSKSPRWHHIPSADSGTPTPFTYVPPLVSKPSEHSTSSHSPLQSNTGMSSSTKLKSRPHVATSDPEIRITPAPAPAPQLTHPVYELPARQLKVMQNLLRENARDKRGKISWKGLCKAFTALGFNIDDTTPGSAVTFIPPNANDRPISIHRPHPERNLVPLKVHRLRYSPRTGVWMVDHLVPAILSNISVVIRSYSI
ncbi:hypothetical protein PILCRDRAFT_812335 [Piloderma croceum F 1598]|uniref:Uncharacterized protein n=1 Tax=Piloderma croceum (strain F 1598) TaxID=765440 RepID=A0A0C3CLN1_PILCF|nr:hypothetical protein PILCRDRAFT_812335 [Piloderma croceum F 1598]